MAAYRACCWCSLHCCLCSRSVPTSAEPEPSPPCSTPRPRAQEYATAGSLKSLLLKQLVSMAWPGLPWSGLGCAGLVLPIVAVSGRAWLSQQSAAEVGMGGMEGAACLQTSLPHAAHAMARAFSMRSAARQAAVPCSWQSGHAGQRLLAALPCSQFFQALHFSCLLALSDDFTRRSTHGDAGSPAPTPF